jgi:hypothetical protein
VRIVRSLFTFQTCIDITLRENKNTVIFKVMDLIFIQQNIVSSNRSAAALNKMKL